MIPEISDTATRNKIESILNQSIIAERITVKYLVQKLNLICDSESSESTDSSDFEYEDEPIEVFKKPKKSLTFLSFFIQFFFYFFILKISFF